MATSFQTLVTNARISLNETTANFWTDAELFGYALNGARNLWKAIIDLHQGHFLTVDESNVSMDANTNVLTGIPADTFRVELIEVRDQTTSSTVMNMSFDPKKVNSPEFTASRALGAVAPSGVTVYYDLIGAGSPIAAPTVEVAPQITSAVPLRFVYTPTLSSSLVIANTNPIPGESDMAIQAWIVAYALGRERPNSQPDPFWLQVFATEKASMLTALTPRQEQEPDYSEALFQVYWD